MASKKTVIETAGTALKEVEAVAGYKLLYGEFKRRNEAVNEIVKCTKKGIKAYLVLEGNTYKISLGEYKSKEVAEMAQKVIEVAGLREDQYTIKAMQKSVRQLK